MSEEMNFLEACQALEDGTCTGIMSAKKVRYVLKNNRILSLDFEERLGMRTAPSEFLDVWTLAD